MVSVSIIIPAYNSQSTIGQAIDSVLKQTFQDFELLICDDASADETVTIIQSYKDPRIRLIGNGKNLGPGPSRDALISVANGQWIAVLDADDVYDERRLGELMRVASRHPNAIIFDEIIECHDTADGLVPWKTVRSPSQFGKDKIGAYEVNVSEWMRCPRTMMQWVAPTHLIRDFGVRHPNIRFGEDLGFILRVLAQTKAPLWYVPLPLYLYRLSSGSLTASAYRFEMLLSVLEEALSENSWDNEIRSAIKKKADDVRKRIIYQRFLTAVVRGQVAHALKQATAHPWVIPQFLWRGLARIPYHVHRLRNDGTRRETV